MKNKQILAWLKNAAAAAVMLGCSTALASSPPPWDFDFDQGEAETEVSAAIERSDNVYQERGDAEAAYKALGDLGPLSDNEEILLWRAWYASEAGLVDEAEDIYRQLLGIDPGYPWYYNALGYLLASSNYGRLEEAFELLERAVEMAPEEPAIIHSYGYASERLGYLAAAEDAYETALSLLEGGYDYEIFTSYGGVLLARGKDYEFAGFMDYISDFEEDEEAAIGFFALQTYWALYKNQIDDDLVAFWKGSVEETPENVWSRSLYALMLQRLGDDAEANRQLDIAGGFIDENSPNDDIDSYGEALHELGRTKEAEKMYRFLINKEPDNPLHFNSLGYLLADDGRKLDEAMELLETALALAPDKPEIISSYAWALHNNGQSAAAAVLARQALDHEPPMGAYERVLAIVEYGEILWSLGYEAAAQDAWERAWNADSNHVDVLEAVEKYDLVFQERLEENDGRAEYTAEVIERAAYIDEEEGAEKAYEYLTALNWLGYGLTEPLLYQQAYYAKKADMNEEAENIYRTLIELNPEEAHYLDHLGFLLATESDRLVEARLILREALELSPEDPSIMDSYGWVLYRLRRLEEASELLGTAAEIVISHDNPDLQVSILTRYGIVLWESEMYEDAINAWNYAWRIDSENEFLAQTLVEYAEVYGYSFFQERFEEEPGILR